MNNYDYPLGADNAKAPWNEPPKVTMDVTVSVSISKTMPIEVDNYDVDLDTIKEEVERQVKLPWNTSEWDDWTVDEFSVYSE